MINLDFKPQLSVEVAMNIDPASVSESANFFAQVVGLLSAWKQDRSATKDQHYKDFIVWLQNHNFLALTEKINGSEELQRELHRVLAGSLEQIDARLDSLATAMAEVSQKIDGLREISRAVSTDRGSLSVQACEILKLFADTHEATGMIVMDHGPAKIVLFIPGSKSATFDDQRFFLDDIAALASANLITLTSYTNSGDPIYSLTRLGGDYAKGLPSVEVNH